jgi:ribosome-associated protein
MNRAAEMAKIIYRAADAKQGCDIKIIDISGLSVIADYFIVTNGNNQPQVDAIVDNIEYEMLKAGYETRRIEGDKQTSGWILLDYGEVIVHVFNRDDRSFYDIERIWKDGKDLKPEEL